MALPMAEPTHKKHRFRKLRLMILSIVGLVLLAGATASVRLGPVIRRKLQSTITSRLDASLTIGTIFYRPPFTVHCFDVRFIAHPRRADGGTELFAARRIDLSLAKLPLGDGPLLISRFKIVGPTLHATIGTDGNFAGADLIGAPQKSPTTKPFKLSDLLRLEHFSVKDGSLVFQDLRDKSGAPTEWKSIGSDIALQGQSASTYSFKLNAAEEPIAQASIDGTIDVDSLLLQITQFKASLQAPDLNQGDGVSPLPTELRKLMQRFAVQGKLTASLSGVVALTDPQSSNLSGDLDIEGGRARLPDSDVRLDGLTLSTHVDRDSSNSIRLRLGELRAVSAGAIFHSSASTILFDPLSQKWSVGGLWGTLDAPPENHGPWGLTGHADFHADFAHDPAAHRTPFVCGVNVIGVNVKPPGFAAPLEQLTGTINAAGNNAADAGVTFHNFVARYGGDDLALDDAHVSLAQFPKRIQVNGLQSRLKLVQNAPQCPGDLGPILDMFKPSGLFILSGTAGFESVMRSDGPGYSPDWDLQLSTEAGKLALLDEQLPVTALNGRMLITKHALSIPGLTGSLLGGTMDLVGTARVVEPIVYEGEFHDRGANVAAFAQTFKIKSPDGSEPSGLGNLGFKFFSQTPAASSSPATQPTSEIDEWLSLLGGDGTLQIDNGNLWALPALQGLSHHTRVAREALTAGEAAAIFSVANRTVYFKHVAIYSPALGLQGSGTETFDGDLDLDIIAAPLGDWKKKLEEIDIPFFSRVLSSAAGVLEKFVGSATSELLYHFRITGDRNNPQVKTIPAPFLTDSTATLFARMLHHDGNTKLVDAVNGK